MILCCKFCTFPALMSTGNMVPICVSLTFWAKYAFIKIDKSRTYVIDAYLTNNGLQFVYIIHEMCKINVDRYIW